MNKPVLVARADSDGVYIAANGDHSAQFYPHKKISVHYPPAKPRPDRALAKAYLSFVYARGRFTPGGLNKYLQFRYGLSNTKIADSPYYRDKNGALRMINSVMRLLDDRYAGSNRYLHRFRVMHHPDIPATYANYR